MTKLPSGYIQRESCVTGGSHIIDTGILASSKVKIDIMFDLRTLSTTGRQYILGARKSNSNTSTEQITVCRTASNGCYVGFGNQNALISSTKGDIQLIDNTRIIGDNVNRLVLDNTEVSLAESIAYNVYDTSAIDSFTGTRNIYLFGLNNAGSTIYSPYDSKIYYCKIWEDGVLVRDYVACVEESTNHAGMYDLVSDTFHLVDSSNYNEGYWTIEPTSNGNGEVEGSIGRYNGGLLRAKPNNGYVLKHWEYNNTVLSTDDDFFFDPWLLNFDLNIPNKGVFNPVAVFAKKVKEDATLGFKMAVFNNMPVRYTDDNGSVYERYLIKCVAEIRSASVSLDGTQKATSSFVINGNFNMVQGDYVYVYNQLGKKVYVGIVESVKESTITCVEINAIFSKDTMLHDNTSMTVTYGTGSGTATNKVTNTIISYALQSVYFPALMFVADNSKTAVALEPFRRFIGINKLAYTPLYSHLASDVYGDYDRTAFPLWTNTGVENLYEKLTQIFNDFNIYVDNKTYIKKEIRNGSPITYIDITLFPRSPLKDNFVIGDNSEEIGNISITEESGNATYLVIYNSAGSTIRAVYLIDPSGQIVKENDFNSPEPTIYSIKVVNSDDNINTLVRQNLTSGKYNHKITFDVILGNNFTLDDFKINKKVNFYYGGKLYESVISAMKYDIPENEGQIKKLNVTLGMVRNNLTSKLNLGKAKKK